MAHFRRGGRVFQQTLKGGKKESGAFNYTQISRILGHSIASLIPSDCWEEDFAELLSKYNHQECPLEITKEFIAEFLPNAIIDVEDLNLALAMPPHCFDSNSFRLVYKIWKSSQMLLLRERTLGFRYDYILRCRLDQSFPEDFHTVLGKLSADEVYVDFVSSNGCGDNIIYASRDHFLDIINLLFSDIIVGNWKGIHIEVMDKLNSLKLQPIVPKSCPVLLSDTYDIQRFSSWLSAMQLETSLRNDVMHWEGCQFDKVVMSGSIVYVAINAGIDRIEMAVESNIECVLAYGISRINDLAGLSRLFSVIYSDLAESFCLLASLFYIHMMKTDFQGQKDNYSRRFIVWDGAKLLASRKEDLCSLPALCSEAIEAASSILIKYDLFDKFSNHNASQLSANEIWNICMKDYETAREICAIYDRSFGPHTAFQYAMDLYEQYGEREDLVELLFHLAMKTNRRSKGLEILESITSQYMDNPVIAKALVWLKS